jgi:putative ABC transport system permease protein
MIGSLELGILYGVMALGVYLTFRVLNFPDLTVDGSFTTGAAMAGFLLLNDVNPVLATLAGGVAGLIAGAITGLLHTYGHIDGLLAGILTMIGLWSINLRIMGRANLPLLRQDTVFTPLRELGTGPKGLMGTWTSIAILAALVLILNFVLDWFLTTNLGLAIQATGDNEDMIRSFGVNTQLTKILTLSLSNGFVAVCGALIAQYQGFADISMGIGLILIGLASVILGQAILGQRRIWQATLAVVVGAVIYRLIIFLALKAGLNPNDMRAITALLVVLALLLPRWGFLRRIPALRLVGKSVKISNTPNPAVSADSAEAEDAGTLAAAGKESGRGDA